MFVLTASARKVARNKGTARQSPKDQSSHVMAADLEDALSFYKKYRVELLR